MASSKIMVHAPVELDWVSGSEFEAGRPGGPRIRLDGDGRTAPSPFDAFVAAIAACAATDVVTILRKQRTPVQSLRVRIEAQRVETVPRRLASAVLHFSISAPGATAEKVARAVELSITRYCSVRSSLASDAAVTWSIDLKA
jgi:putative redox protein